MNRLLIVQPYIPEYRVSFFDRLRRSLSEVSIDLVVAAATSGGTASVRRDDRTLDCADIVLGSRKWTLAGRELNLRSLSRTLRATSPDIVVLEQAIKNLEIYPLVGRHIMGQGPRLALWGQGRSFSTTQGKFEASTKQWLTQRCDWFFAYTQGGADYVIERGFPNSRVTTLNNTIDTSLLEMALGKITSRELQDFMREQRLTRGRTALFIGGVDEHKGLDLLLASARQIEQRLPGFVLLIAGAGVGVQKIRAAEASGFPIRYLGRVEGHFKALALTSAEILMVPRWVGLVAIDSFVAGRPIVTTAHPSHSSEFSYLVPERNSIVTRDDVTAYADSIVELLKDSEGLKLLQDGARASSGRYSLDSMVNNYVIGVCRCLESTQRTLCRGL